MLNNFFNLVNVNYVEICQPFSTILWIVVDLVAPLYQFLVETIHLFLGST
jgi:hypothetical protein